MRDDARFLEALRCRHRAGERLRYLFFWGHRPSNKGVTAACFSQWYTAPFEVDGQHYATAEHFMMAEKATLFGDIEIRQQILAAPSPAKAKALGSSVRGFEESTWTAHRFGIVVRGNQAKFSQNPVLAEFLHNTRGRVLAEASPVDRVWGIGLAHDAPEAQNPTRWRGLNLLGFALMEVRDAGAQYSAEYVTST